MSIEEIGNSFKSSVADSIQLFPDGKDRYRIFTPFHFDDGDHFVIVLRKEKDGKLSITDEGHTYMHLSYDVDLSSLNHGHYDEMIRDALERYGVREDNGSLSASFDKISDAGNILYGFVQCLISIKEVSYLSHEETKDTIAVFEPPTHQFKHYVTDFIRESTLEFVANERIRFNYVNRELDIKGEYPVDYRINGIERPLHIYAISTNDKCLNATIGILKFREWKIPFTPLGIFRDEGRISRKALSHFTDASKQKRLCLKKDKAEIRGFLTKNLSLAR